MHYFTHKAAHATPIIPLSPPLLASWLKQQDARTRNWVKAQSFNAEPATTLLVPSENGEIACVLAGVEAIIDTWSLAHVPAALPAGSYALEAKWKPAQLAEAALGFALARYQFGRYKPTKPKALTLQLPKAVDIAAIEAKREAIALVRVGCRSHLLAFQYQVRLCRGAAEQGQAIGLFSIAQRMLPRFAVVDAAGRDFSLA